jgi:hypothetical protein
MKKTLFSLSELGKRIAFTKGNRAKSVKNLKQKKMSIAMCGQLMPIVVIDGKDAHDAGLTLIDVETGKEVPVSEVSNYVVIVEGQHRFLAVMELQQDDVKEGTNIAPTEIIAIYAPNPKNVSPQKLISELNINSVVWNGTDYITGAALCNPLSELLKYAKELADLKSTKSDDNLPNTGYPTSSISKYLTFSPALDKQKLADCMDNGVDSLPTANIERAKKIIENALEVGFKHKYLSHKYFIDYIIDESNATNIDDILESIKALKPSQVEAITKIKGDDYILKIRKVIKG